MTNSSQDLKFITGGAATQQVIVPFSLIQDIADAIREKKRFIYKIQNCGDGRCCTGVTSELWIIPLSGATAQILQLEVKRCSQF